MAIYKRLLTGSTDGLPIKVVATGTPGTTIHIAVAGTTVGTYDEIWLWAYNSAITSTTLTIEFGGATAPDQNIVITLAAQSGLVPIIPGLILRNAKVVTAFASAANVVTLSGFVNAITD